METDTPAAPRPSRGIYLYVIEDDAAGLAQHVEHADLDAKDEALSWAVHLRKQDMVQTLLEAGGYVNTPRLSHINHFRDNKLGDVRKYDEKVRDLFTCHSECDRILHNAYENRDIAIMTLLLKAHAEIYGQYHHEKVLYEYERNIVLDIIQKDDTEMMQLIIDHESCWEPDFHIPNDRYWTPLMWACEWGSADMMKILVDSESVDQQGHGDGTDENQTTKATCVHICIEAGNREALKVLMENFVDINIYSGRGMSALTSAIERYVDCFDELYDVGLDDDAADYQELEKLMRLTIIFDILVYNVDFDFPDLVDVPDADIDLHHVQYLPRICLWVDKFRHEQSVDYLRTLKRHHVDVQDRWGKTALHRSGENGQFEAVKTLLLKGARDDIPDFWGGDVLEAVERRHNDFLERLADSKDNKYICYGSYGDSSAYYRMEAGDALAAGKLPEFRRIGRYILRTRRYHKHVAPILRKAIELSGLNIDGDQFLRDLHLLSVEED